MQSTASRPRRGIVGNYVEITLTENLSEDPDGFDHYDQKIDAGAWAMLSLTALGGGKYKWTLAGTSTISPARRGRQRHSVERRRDSFRFRRCVCAGI